MSTIPNRRDLQRTLDCLDCLGEKMRAVVFGTFDGDRPIDEQQQAARLFLFGAERGWFHRDRQYEQKARAILRRHGEPDWERNAPAYSEDPAVVFGTLCQAASALELALDSPGPVWLKLDAMLTFFADTAFDPDCIKAAVTNAALRVRRYADLIKDTA